MSIHAGFFKRLFSFIVDLTLVIVVTWLLYLFPFNMIISKSIDKDYRNNIKKPNNEISEEYSGKVSYFGTSSDGKFSVLRKFFDNKAMAESDFDSYSTVLNVNYNTVSSDLSNMLTNMDIPYSADTAIRDQFYSIVYRDYTYITEINTILQNYPMDDVFDNKVDDEFYTSYSILKDTKKITDEQYNSYVNEYKEKLANYNKESLGLLIKTLNAYGEKNSDAKITSQLAYSTIASAYSALREKVSDLDSTFTTDDVDKLKAYVNLFRTYQEAELNNAKTNPDGTYIVDEELYYNCYYGLYFEQFNKQLSYYVQVYNHTTWAIIYSLSMFTLVFSIYTAVLRGNTLGRRCVKIKLTDGFEKEKLNPVKALLHDVPFKFLYLIVIGLFSLLAAGIAMIVFTIVDILMIAFTKQHKTIRDIFSRTRVVEARNY